MRKPLHLDLFTGLGAFSLGFERQGFRTITQVEIDKNCRKLLESKWPKVKRHDDVKTFQIDMMPECPKVVTFGSPCQDLSVAGQRAGMVGERSSLFYAATRIIQRLVGYGLEFAVWENVEGAFSSNGGRDFAGVLAELGRCGAHDIGYRVLDCQFWGLAQRRRRVFLVADFRGQRTAEILSFESCLRGHPAPSREAGQRVASTVSASPPSRRNGGSNPTEGTMIPSVAPPCGHHHRRDDLDNDTYIVMAHGQANAEQVRDGSPSLTCNHEAPIVIPIQSVQSVREKKQNGIGIGKDGEACNTLTGRDQHAIAFSVKDHGQDASHEISPTLRSGMHDKGNANGGCGPAVAFQARIARNGRGQPSEIAPALRAAVEGDTADSKPLIAFTQNQRQEVRELSVAGSQSAIRRGDAKNETLLQGNFGVRRLTPRECERLMGLPDDWTAGFSDSVRYRMIGNSAAVPVIEWLAKSIHKVLK